MTLKHRLKRLEEKIKSPDQEKKMWMIRTDYKVRDVEEFEDLKSKGQADARIQEIKEGKVQQKKPKLKGTQFIDG